MVHMKNVIQNKKTALSKLSTDSLGEEGNMARTKSKANPWENTGLLLLRNPGKIHRKNLNRLLFILLMGERGTQENKKSKVTPQTHKRSGPVTFDISDPPVSAQALCP